MELKEVKNQAVEVIKKASSLQDLDVVYRQYLGKKGELAGVFVSLKDLPVEQKKELGNQANLVKKELERLISEKSVVLKVELGTAKMMSEKIDVTRPGNKLAVGHLHPITLVKMQVEDIFRSLGFEIVEGPELETEWYNFDALNVPADHPARDMQDTFWIQNKPGYLMRTQTSPVQVRYMEKNQPPLRIVAPGRVFRNEATDASHEAQFYQLEGLMVDKEISAGNFKAIIEEFLNKFFGTKVKIRLRPGFFPFTEPSFEIDAQRPGEDWLELMGAGMVHPQVFKSAGLSKDWQGFAFGVGLERLAMVKYKIKDLRMFYQNDLRFLEQF